MKALTTAGLTKLIQLIKSSFISNTDTVTTQTVTLADVATSGDYNDLSNKPTIPTLNGYATETYVDNGLATKVSKSGDSMTGDLETSASLYLTNIASTVASSVSRLYFGPKSSPYNYITANTGGVFGIYNSAGKGISCYPTQNFFSSDGIDLGRTNNKWKNIYASGKLVGVNSSLAIDSIISGANAGATAIQPNDNISTLTNDSGFITGITSNDVTTALGFTPYNSTNPDGYLTSSDFKTINNTSIVGSGDIDTKEIFVATYNDTTFADVLAAYNNGKTLILDDYSNDTYANCIYADSSSIVFARCGYENSVLVLTQYIVDTNGWDSNTYNLADTDLSNLSATGQAVIDGKADTDLSNLSATGKTVLDGQWVSQTATIVENLQLHTNNNISYTLSDIPNDGHKYEVIISCLGVSTATSGQATALFVSSSELNYAQCVYRGTPRSAANVMVGGSIIIPLGTDRGITIQRSEDYYGTANIYLRGYRRIGSNT